MSGKLINLFLMDGDPTGRIKCTLSNWTGIAYKIPRTMLDKARSITYLNQSGVYMLFGNSNETGNPVVYIGQAGTRKNGHGIINRLDEHRRNSNKDWWIEAVALTTSNNSFGPTEISYLENRFTNMAIDADRYEVTNSNDPTQGNITEEKESEMNEFIDYSKLVIGAMGYKVFEPLVIKDNDKESNKDNDNEPLLYFKNSNANAIGKRTYEGFVVFAGSKISSHFTKSVPEGILKLREADAKNISPDYILNKDILFKSPYAAAGFVGGASLNGITMWKTEDGVTLKDFDMSK